MAKSLEELFYKPNNTLRELTKHESDLADLGVDAAQRAALRTKALAVSAEIGDHLGSIVVGKFLDREVQALAPEARTGGDVTKLANEKRDLEAGRQSLQRVRELHGAEGEKLLTRTQRFLDTLPHTKALLAQHGLSNDPTLVEALVDHVRVSGAGMADR